MELKSIYIKMRREGFKVIADVRVNLEGGSFQTESLEVTDDNALYMNFNGIVDPDDLPEEDDEDESLL